MDLQAFVPTARLIAKMHKMKCLNKLLRFIIFYLCKNREKEVNKKQRRILIAPLDWGLGHLSRCMPIIQYLIAQGVHVYFAGNESQQAYVKTIYPDLDCLLLPGYEVRYARKRFLFAPKLLAQLPRLYKRIRAEHIWLQSIVEHYQIDAVISDNRYGLYHSQIPCVLLTHQLQVQTGISQFWDRCLQKIHYRFIERYSACWLVDTPAAPGLSGVLAHPQHLPSIPTTYIGYLSQCASPQEATDQEPYILVLLSGVEPQRSIIAQQIWQQALQSTEKIVFVAGSDHIPVPNFVPEHIVYHQRLSGMALQVCINHASIVICRSGYSSIMDLIALGKKAILIPTPGQTEQLLLAKNMQQQGLFMMQSQHTFQLHSALSEAATFPFVQAISTHQFELYRAVIADWLKTI